MSLPSGFVHLQAPEGFMSANIGGRSIVAEPDGSVIASMAEAQELMSHGFQKWRGDSHVVTIDEMTHSELIAEVVRRTMEACTYLSCEELRIRLQGATPPDDSLPGEDLANTPALETVNPPDPSNVTREDIAKFDLPALYRYLTAIGNPLKAARGQTKEVVRKLVYNILDEREAEAEALKNRALYAETEKVLEEHAILEEEAEHYEQPSLFSDEKA